MLKFEYGTTLTLTVVVFVTRGNRNCIAKKNRIVMRISTRKEEATGMRIFDDLIDGFLIMLLALLEVC